MLLGLLWEMHREILAANIEPATAQHRCRPAGRQTTARGVDADPAVSPTSTRLLTAAVVHGSSHPPKQPSRSPDPAPGLRAATGGAFRYNAFREPSKAAAATGSSSRNTASSERASTARWKSPSARFSGGGFSSLKASSNGSGSCWKCRTRTLAGSRGCVSVLDASSSALKKRSSVHALSKARTSPTKGSSQPSTLQFADDEVRETRALGGQLQVFGGIAVPVAVQ
jgi:hypothetical protein